MMSEVGESIASLHKSVVVPVEPARAFELFTARIADWWPLATHSVGLGEAVDVTFPSEVGGDIVETMRDGSTEVWGTVTQWDPPRKVSYTWHPGRRDSWVSEVEIRFTTDGSGGTTVEMTHSGWDRRSDGAAARGGYDTGWDVVLGAYVTNAST